MFSRGTALALFTVLLVSSGAGGAAPVPITLHLHGDHSRHEGRILEAANDAIEQYTEWLGARPFDSLAITTVPPGAAIAADAPGQITAPLHWLQPARSLSLEAEVARAIARQWFGIAVRVPDQFIADGIAEYAQSRIVEQIYDRRLQRLSYSTYEARYFGGLLPWAIRALRVERTTAGVGRSGYRRFPNVEVKSTDVESRPVRAAKIATGLVTLERYIGWPALQRGLHLAASRYRGRTMTAADFSQALSNAAERDLSWFLQPLFDSGTEWDYAVERITVDPPRAERCGPANCIRSTIEVRRAGNTAFTGTSHPPSGEFESGRGVEIELEFADGQKVTERWDGRAETKTLVYDAPSPVTRATVDPRNVLMIDLRRLNNTRAVTPDPRVGMLAWSARWMIWLQDLLITQSVLY